MPRLHPQPLARNLACLVGAGLLAGTLHAQPASPAAPPPAADTAAQTQAVEFAHDVVRSGNAQGRSFGVIDKRAATLWVFDGRGQPLARTPVLVGQAVGDVAPPDIGTRPLSRVQAGEKVTSAGRYDTQPGRNTQGEDIVWLDYDAALSMHRVRNVPGEGRPQRLQSPRVADRRISFGCVNIPASFYDRVIDPLFARAPGVVYVLPETRPLTSVFPFASGGAAATLTTSR